MKEEEPLVQCNNLEMEKKTKHKVRRNQQHLCCVDAACSTVEEESLPFVTSQQAHCSLSSID